MNRGVNRKFFTWICISITALSVLVFGLLKFVNYGYSDTVNEPCHEKYSEYFNDMQQTQITAARKYGIKPIKDRKIGRAHV